MHLALSRYNGPVPSTQLLEDRDAKGAPEQIPVVVGQR